MSLDLYEREATERLDAMPKTMVPEVGAFDGFLRGTGVTAMETFAKSVRAASLGVSSLVTPSLERAGGTELSDRYFKVHDDIFGSAVDYWTAKKAEVGVAGQIVGQLLATLPMVIASPAAAVAAIGLGVSEDLARKDVSPTKAVAAGAVQAAGLGLGIWMPILGANGWQRVLLGGAGFNLAQGVVTRGASEAILQGTKAEGDFKAFDGEAMTLDVLLGMAFGSLAHLSPKARAQGTEMWGKIADWAKTAKPSEVDALLTLRQAQHLNVDSMPGKSADPLDIDAHNVRMRTAIEQLARGERVDVSDLPGPKVAADPLRIQEADANVKVLLDSVKRVLSGEDVGAARRAEIESFIASERVRTGEEAVRGAIAGEAARISAEDTPAFLRSAEQMIALRGEEAKPLEPVIQQAIEIAKKPAFLRTAEEKVMLEAILSGRLPDYLAPMGKKSASILESAVADALQQFKVKTEGPPARVSAEPPPPRGEGERPGGPEAKEVDYVSREADAFASERPDLAIRVGTDDKGEPVTVSIKDYLDGNREAVKRARDDVKLFEVAAACMLGVR